MPDLPGYTLALKGTQEAWERWKAAALAAEADRHHARQTALRQPRPAHTPCTDPFCETCVPSGEELE